MELYQGLSPTDRAPAPWADLIAGLVMTVGLAGIVSASLPPDGWLLTGALGGYGALVAMLYRGQAGKRVLGWANRATLARAVITAVLAGALLQPGLFIEQAWTIAALSLIALALDGLDGWLARRLDETSRFGARFDMETDAALILVLCAGLWLSGLAPAWVLAIGLMRHAFLLAGRVWPWLARPLPERFGRKLVCVVQVGVLVLALLPFIGEAWRLLMLAAALLLLGISFLIDVAWLARRRGVTEHPDWRTP